MTGWATVGVNPDEFDLGAVGAVRRLLHDQGLKAENVDLFEVSIKERTRDDTLDQRRMLY